MLVLILFAFLAGIVTILSPCILPVLPIILSGTVHEGKQRPFGIVTGFVVSFTFFTLFLSSLVRLIGVPAEFLRIFSIVTVIGFGLSLLFPKVQVLLEKLFILFSKFTPHAYGSGFAGGLLVGVSLGLIWTPCVGPILASVIALALTGTVSGSTFLITLAYALGTGLPMLAITYGGQRLIRRVPWLLANTPKIQRGFGVLMIMTGIALAANFDRSFQVWILKVFPNYGTGLTKLEEVNAVKTRLNQQQETEFAKITAPDFIGGTKWLNSEPLSLTKELRGKVVLVDFWTYTCINCIRTFPYITKWYETYKDKGFVIVGVHSPEFEFEKKAENVEKAMKDFGITYPVVQDNEFAIWRAYNNRYWPAHYLIDREGRVVYTHFGEGKYLETENRIRELLGEEVLPKTDGLLGNLRQYQTPEIYLGYKRAESYNAQAGIVLDKTKTYAFHTSTGEGEVDLRGAWRVGPENITAEEANAQLRLQFTAGKVFLVMATDHPDSKVTVMLDGKPLQKEYWTPDMNDQGQLVINESKKYDVLNLPIPGEHTLILTFEKGVEAYAFTFGTST